MPGVAALATANVVTPSQQPHHHSHHQKSAQQTSSVSNQAESESDSDDDSQQQQPVVKQSQSNTVDPSSVNNLISKQIDEITGGVNQNQAVTCIKGLDGVIKNCVVGDNEG